MAIGRPSSYSPELADAICEAIALDHRGLDPICESREDFPTSRTVRNWMLREPEFFQKYARAKEIQMEYLESQLLALSDDDSNDVLGTMPNNASVQRSRLMVDTRKWLMCKLAPKRFGDKVEHSGQVDIGLADQLRAAEERLKKL